MSYLGIVGEATAERVIEKSRFLAYAKRIVGEEEAKAFLTHVRALHPAATHVAYGYIADEKGNLLRFSDDGEPQGTAGMPILGVIRSQNLVETAVAVVRYFGGIKLGAGGLTRAYAGAAADGLLAAEKRSFELCALLRLTVGYSDVNAAQRFLSEEGAEVLGREFSSGAAFTVAVRESEKEKFLSRAMNALSGRVTVEEGGRSIRPLPIE